MPPIPVRNIMAACAAEAEKLEIVTEDLLEDRISALNSVVSKSLVTNASKTLPLSSQDFLAAYKAVLTE